MFTTRNLLSLSLSLSCAFSLSLAGCDGEPDEELVERAGGILQGGPPVSDYFIVTRPDTRRCASPVCGGWFVKRVNAELTRCGDGSWEPECHMYTFDLTGLGLGDDATMLFSEDFEQGRALVRGELIQRELDFDGLADVLVVEEGWGGVTGSEPEGHFSRLDLSPFACKDAHCGDFVQRVLNTNNISELAGVELAASGANPSEVEAGEAELADSGLLGVGSYTGEPGELSTFVASEFYSRVTPGQ